MYCTIKMPFASKSLIWTQHFRLRNHHDLSAINYFPKHWINVHRLICWLIFSQVTALGVPIHIITLGIFILYDKFERKPFRPEAADSISAKFFVLIVNGNHKKKKLNQKHRRDLRHKMYIFICDVIFPSVRTSLSSSVQRVIRNTLHPKLRFSALFKLFFINNCFFRTKRTRLPECFALCVNVIKNVHRPIGPYAVTINTVWKFKRSTTWESRFYNSKEDRDLKTSVRV